MTSPAYTGVCRPLVLLHDGLVGRVEGVRLEKRPLMALLVGGADGVRSV